MSPAAASICRTGYIPAERVIPDARPGGDRDRTRGRAALRAARGDELAGRARAAARRGPGWPAHGPRGDADRAGRVRQDPARAAGGCAGRRRLRGRRAAGRAGLPHRSRARSRGRRRGAGSPGTRRREPGGGCRAGAGRPGAADRAGQLRARPGTGRPGGGHAGRAVPPGPHPGHQPGTPGRARRVRLPGAAAGAARRRLGRGGRRVRGRSPVRHPGPRGEPGVRADRRQRGRDRRGVLPAGRHAAGHRAGRGPVPGARARAARGPAGGPPGAAGRRRRPAGTAPLPGGPGVVEL